MPGVSQRLLAGVSIISLVSLGLAVGASMAQAPASPGQSQPEVSSPEPAPNPVREMRDPASPPSNESDGLDAGLETIEEQPETRQATPAPALRQEGSGEWQAPLQGQREGQSQGDGLSPEERRRNAEAAAAQARAARENELPRMVGPNIPIVPLDLLFPPELAASIEVAIVRETRGSVVTVAVMDRNTATLQQVRIPVGSTVTAGPLSMKATACFKSAPEDPIEAWAYMEVVDRGRPAPTRLAVLPQRDRAKQREARGPRLLRRGWMIASSPVVTPVDHPVFDVWVLDCEGSAGGPRPVATLEELQRPSAGQAAPTTGQGTTPQKAPDARP
jgi:hypothetical protein